MCFTNFKEILVTTNDVKWLVSILYFEFLSCPNFTRKTRNAPSRTMPSSTFFQTLNQHYQIDHVLICNDGSRRVQNAGRPLYS